MKGLNFFRSEFMGYCRKKAKEPDPIKEQWKEIQKDFQWLKDKVREIEQGNE